MDVTRYSMTLHRMEIPWLGRAGMPDLPWPIIKKNCPFIYDVSVNIAQKLNKKYNIHIADSEIGYISIHIGYLIDVRQHNFQIKNVNFQSYLSLQQTVYNSAYLLSTVIYCLFYFFVISCGNLYRQYSLITFSWKIKFLCMPCRIFYVTIE